MLDALRKMEGVFDNEVKAQSRALRAAALVLEREIKIELSRPGGGRFYKRGKRGRMHQASAPGQPPAVDTGRLRNSIGHQFNADFTKVRVGSGVKYAALLEYGTIKMAPRPFMRAALERAKKQMTDEVVSELRKGP